MKKALSEKTVAAQIRKRKGNLAAVARYFGVCRQAVHQFVRAHSALQDVENECRESRKDYAESKLDAAINKGEGWAICFYLKTQAKDRGYVERSEFTGAGGGPLQLRVIEDEGWYGNSAFEMERARSGVLNGTSQDIQSNGNGFRKIDGDTGNRKE